MPSATITTIRIAMRSTWTDSDKYAIDMRMGSRGVQKSAKVREYETAKEAGEVEEIAADIRKFWRAGVELIGGHYE
jgi:hypothetical protein